MIQQEILEKREALLNPKFKFIGISSTDIDDDKQENNKNNELINGNKNLENTKNDIKFKPFCAYFTLK